MINCNLAVLMAERGLNIQDVANKTGLSRTTVSALYNNNGKGIQFDTMESLCELLEVLPGDLFTRFVIREEFKYVGMKNINESVDHYPITADEPDDLNEYISEIQCGVIIAGNVTINKETIFKGNFTLEVTYGVTPNKEIDNLNIRFADKNLDFIKNKPRIIQDYLQEQIESIVIDAGLELEDIENITHMGINWN